jgi:ATP-dependent RNA helicase DHX37/DHR1
MRRSKSDPAKYARNYRSISQRRMTEYDNLDEDKEIDRLRDIIRTSETHLGQAKEQHDNAEKKRKRATKSTKDDDMELSELILSEEVRNNLESGYGDDDAALVLMPKKKSKKIKTIELTPQEIRQAKLSQKSANRKLNQLTTRSDQKKRRADLYSKLEQNAISAEEIGLLASSSTLGKRETKREALKRLLSRERAGISLTEQERDILYSEKEIDETERVEHVTVLPPKPLDSESVEESQENANKKNSPKKSKKKSSKKSQLFSENTEGRTVPSLSDVRCSLQHFTTLPIPEKSKEEKKVPEQSGEAETATTMLTTTCDTPKAPNDFAAQIMASLTTLKKKTDAKPKEIEQGISELERIANSEEKSKAKKTAYIPREPAILKSAAAIGLEPSVGPITAAALAVQTFSRPQEVQDSRTALPVCSMEFEIVDEIRNNDVTILCSETGSGKSTQVPQFLYENGFTVPGSSKDEPLLIGVTQPRRVAAVSTAKRVCYEMGQGDGQVIKSKNGNGNLVAYQTRYESAGLGAGTRVKFMTDGILLQEIQSDLLLRKYGVIVLDEAHERNLNTDVLLGLLSVAIPLRRKASEEEGSTMKPLKLVVMSATLRVEDFTGNDKLFPDTTPAVVKVPGRTHPVTIHHSKITELDDYEAAACKKICQIHRKLPKGGILVFLTGKQEIVRMVNRLRKSLSVQADKKVFDSDNDTKTDTDATVDDQNGAPRDLDDDEIDGDIFMDDNVDDFDDMDSDSDDVNHEGTTRLTADGTEVPAHAIVLPLYSMLSVEEQARVFAPIAEGQRLIIVATNIAETSITIPGIAYVVDTGRQKCRNYHAGTGVASYDVMWISKAAADQSKWTTSTVLFVGISKL